MTAIVITLIAGSLPACFAITAAHRAGARGWAAYYVWAIEECAERLIAHARMVRDLSAWNERRKV